jgi:hypothetical protein
LEHFFLAESSSSQAKLFSALSDLSILPQIETSLEVQPSSVIFPKNK